MLVKEDTNLGTKTYGYDNIYELTSASYEKNMQNFTWQYDAAGNRLSSNESLLPSQSTATTYSPNKK
jgi:hypothetical protein